MNGIDLHANLCAFLQQKQVACQCPMCRCPEESPWREILFQNLMESRGEWRREKSREWRVGAEGIAAHGEWQWRLGRCKTRHLTKGDSVPWIGVREGRAVVRGVANIFIMRFYDSRSRTLICFWSWHILATWSLVSACSLTCSTLANTLWVARSTTNDIPCFYHVVTLRLRCECSASMEAVTVAWDRGLCLVMLSSFSVSLARRF